MKLVIIEWEDSCSQSGWHPMDISYEGTSHCITLGLKVAETENFITVAPSRSGNIRVCDSLSIPKSCIKRIRYLRIK